ncbi:MAG: hypothetical protein WAW37_03390 [Syntrophobacteraceae bacterium]
MGGLISKCRPAVPRYWHFLTAGVVWLVVGIGLAVVACRWFSQTDWPLNLALAAASICLGLAVYLYGFSGIAGRNIARIEAQPDFACLFAFQPWRSYLLILVMMLFGYILRHLPVPKSIDAVIYLTMGSALAFSSSLYFEAFSKN